MSRATSRRSAGPSTSSPSTRPRKWTRPSASPPLRASLSCRPHRSTAAAARHSAVALLDQSVEIGVRVPAALGAVGEHEVVGPGTRRPPTWRGSRRTRTRCRRGARPPPARWPEEARSTVGGASKGRSPTGRPLGVAGSAPDLLVAHRSGRRGSRAPERRPQGSSMSQARSGRSRTHVGSPTALGFGPVPGEGARSVRELEPAAPWASAITLVPFP